MHDYEPCYYRPDGTRYPKGTEGLFEWAKDFEDMKKRKVRVSRLWWGAEVSTVWLGINHAFHDDAPPLIFESMTFYPRRWGYAPDMDRYSTKRQALRGHLRMVKKWSDPWQAIQAVVPALLEAAGGWLKKTIRPAA